jgi:hypothetical protein
MEEVSMTTVKQPKSVKKRKSVKQPKQKSKVAPKVQAQSDGQHVLKRFHASIAK